MAKGRAAPGTLGGCRVAYRNAGLRTLWPLAGPGLVNCWASLGVNWWLSGLRYARFVTTVSLWKSM